MIFHCQETWNFSEKTLFQNTLQEIMEEFRSSQITKQQIGRQISMQMARCLPVTNRLFDICSSSISSLSLLYSSLHCKSFVSIESTENHYNSMTNKKFLLQFSRIIQDYRDMRERSKSLLNTKIWKIFIHRDSQYSFPQGVLTYTLLTLASAHTL